MTDKTDIAALRTLSLQRLKEIANGDSMLMGERVDLANTALRFHKELGVAVDAFKNAATELFSVQDKLEAGELKGEQVPVAVVELNDNLTVAEIRGDIPRRKAVRELYEGALVLGQELFAVPQKPVISKEKLCDWLEDNFDIDDSQRDAFANCFAHHCNCIVKKED